jgi:hypothetical protein
MTDWRADLPYCRIQNLVERDIAGLREPVGVRWGTYKLKIKRVKTLQIKLTLEPKTISYSKCKSSQRSTSIKIQFFNRLISFILMAGRLVGRE